jgi:hypothetical protein
VLKNAPALLLEHLCHNARRMPCMHLMFVSVPSILLVFFFVHLPSAEQALCMGHIILHD